jgi:hypothetical protein
MLPHPGRRIADVLPCRGTLWHAFLRPLLVSVLNTPPEEASADLAGAVLRETFARGAAAIQPRLATPNLAAAFVEPALRRLRGCGTQIALGRRLVALEREGDRIAALRFADGDVALSPADAIVLSVPPWGVQDLLPDLAVPTAHCAIVNAHFKLAPPAGAPAMLGVIGGTAEWIFAFDDRLSVTVSAADHLVERDNHELAGLLWRDVAAAHGLARPIPPCRIVKEKRATFAATPVQNGRRPACRTRWRNLLLAGDWTDTGLPATIEGALRSGETAAGLAA